MNLQDGPLLINEFAYGVYKFYIEQYSAYFYIDYRDAYYGYYTNCPGFCNDIFIKYEKNLDKFFYLPCDCDANNPDDINWQSIDNGDVLYYFKIQEQPAPNTSLFPNYWANSLVLTQTSTNHPRLVWGPNPSFSTTNYKVYRAVSNTPVSDPSTLSYALRYTSPNASTFSFTDGDILIGTGQYFYYYVTACQVRTPKPVWESERSNYTSVHGGMYKKANVESKSEEALITDYKLTQNYPNPFNPSTIISYQIPTKSFVTLKVYDVLGNEIATLVNEEKAAGTYQVNFSNQQITNYKPLASGMYFYTLTAGKFTDTKKFILLK